MRRLHCLLLLFCGCGLADTTDLALCDGSEPPRCQTRDRPCDPPRLTQAECIDGAWTCLDEPFVVATEGVCRPYEQIGPITAIGPAFEDGGTCRVSIGRTSWAPDELASADAACAPVAAVDPLSSFSDPNRLLDITDTIHLDNGTVALYRLYDWDETAPFGVREAGSGVAPFVNGELQIPDRVMWPTSPYRSAFLFEGLVFMTTCGDRPHDLRYDCTLSVVDPNDLFDADAYRMLADPIFTAGPQHSVRHYPGDGLAMTTAVGFGSEIILRWATDPRGPWSEEIIAARCELPADDPDAFCDSVRQHPHLRPAGYPGRMHVTYRIGSLAEDRDIRQAARPDLYTARATQIYADFGRQRRRPSLP